MRAGVIAAPGRAVVASAACPEPGPGQVLLRLEGSGVCASSLPLWEGRSWFEYPQAPGAPGHEGWGRIVAVGAGVSGLTSGDRVAALTYRAHAEYDIAEASAVVPLPTGLDGVAMPGEPLGCAVNIFARSGIEAGQTVAIVGIGFLGALLTQLAAHAGARVIAISRRPFSLDIARAAGAQETIVMDDHWRVLEAVKRLTDGRWCERVIEAVGLQWPLDLAGEITGERGPQRYVDGMRTAVDLMAAGVLDPTPLFTHHFPLERLGEALDLTRQRPDGFMKALVTAQDTA